MPFKARQYDGSGTPLLFSDMAIMTVHEIREGDDNNKQRFLAASDDNSENTATEENTAAHDAEYQSLAGLASPYSRRSANSNSR